MQKDAKRRKEQLSGYLIIQRNVKKWVTLRTWEWFLCFGKIKSSGLIGESKRLEEEKLAKEREAAEAAEREKANAGAAAKAAEEAAIKKVGIGCKLHVI